MKSLVIGYGSIGTRHARILKELGCEVGVLSRRVIEYSPYYQELDRALESLEPEYVVIANRTSEHHSTLKQLKAAGFRGLVLVEKPLFSVLDHFDDRCFKKVMVAYNLRFHPLLLKLHDLFKDRSIITAQAYVGKDLKTWRPGADYRKSYSALADQGGGVLRDLSHELDYMLWLLGGWTSVTAVGGHYSNLEIETDDAFSLMMKTKRCENVFVQMNYVDHAGHRSVCVNADDLNVIVDLLNGWIEVNGTRETSAVERDFTYREEHKAVLEGRLDALCSYDEGLDRMRLIVAAEKAAKIEKWVKK